MTEGRGRGGGAGLRPGLRALRPKLPAAAAAGRAPALLLTVLLAGPGSMGAQTDGGALTLSQAVEATLRQHPSLGAARAGVAAAEAGIAEARATRLPWLSAEAAFTRFELPMVVAPLHGFDPRQPPAFERGLAQGSLSLTYTLFDGGGRGARIGRARAQTEGAEARASAATESLLAAVTSAYLLVASAREVLEAHDRQLAALSSEGDRAQQLLREGRAANVVVLRAQAALSRARAERVQAAAELEVAERELARLMGADAAFVQQLALAPVALAPASPLPARPELVARAGRGNRELARATSRVAAAEATAAEARSAWFPRLQLGGRYVEYGSSAGSFTGEWQGGVQLGYPLFMAGARRHASDRADAEARASREELRVTGLGVERAVEEALAALESARARVAALAAAVEQSAEVARIEKLALDAGAGVQTDYLRAEAELFTARAALTAARHGEIAARVELARLTGELSPEWLARNLESGP
ncbi:MAG: TolC family protein [Gemmatimonadetes bacterium]|nr:TolC family protein [Gemmatimonadota bacterium]